MNGSMPVILLIIQLHCEIFLKIAFLNCKQIMNNLNINSQTIQITAITFVYFSQNKKVVIFLFLK